MILRHPYKVILNLKNSMTAISVVYDATSVRSILPAKANRLKAGGLNPMMDSAVMRSWEALLVAEIVCVFYHERFG